MTNIYDNLYEELLAVKEDIEDHLENKAQSPPVKKLAEAELKDVERMIKKWEKGRFDVCEDTGKSLPEEILLFQPVASFREAKRLSAYLKKPVYPID